jgi:hypothetical protein
VPHIELLIKLQNILAFVGLQEANGADEMEMGRILV